MRAPRALGLVDKANGFGSQPRCLAVLFADIGRFVGITEHPARGNLAIADPGVGVVGPRVITVIAPRFQVFIVGRAFLVIEPVRPRPPEPVVPRPGIEPAIRLPRTDHAVGGETQPGHALGVGLHMGLSQQPAIHPRLAQVIAQRHLAHPKRKAVPLRPMG